MKVKAFGIDIIVHWSFFFIVLAIATPVLLEGFFPYNVLSFGGIFCVLTFSIIGHELAHSFVAKILGYETRNIAMFIFGGMAVLKGNPTRKEEACISFAGPLFNFALAIIISALSYCAKDLGPDDSILFMLSFSYFVNIVIAFFNMIPAYPMDGGRIFRAAMCHFYSEEYAEEITYKAGKFFAVLFAIISLVTCSPILLLISVYILLVIWQESSGDNWL